MAEFISGGLFDALLKMVIGSMSGSASGSVPCP